MTCWSTPQATAWGTSSRGRPTARLLEFTSPPSLYPKFCQCFSSKPNLKGERRNENRRTLFLVPFLPLSDAFSPLLSIAVRRSFQRQLNLYGFVRISSGPHKGCYAHAKFRKGHRELCQQVTRQVGGNNAAAAVRRNHDRKNH